MVTLNNGVLNVLIDEMGAQIRSVKKDDKEYMWQADPQIWKSTAPLIARGVVPGVTGVNTEIIGE